MGYRTIERGQFGMISLSGLKRMLFDWINKVISHLKSDHLKRETLASVNGQQLNVLKEVRWVPKVVSKDRNLFKLIKNK